MNCEKYAEWISSSQYMKHSKILFTAPIGLFCIGELTMKKYLKSSKNNGPSNV